MTEQKQQTHNMLLMGFLFSMTTNVSAMAYQNKEIQEVNNSPKNKEQLVSSVGRKGVEISLENSINPTVEQRQSYWQKNKNALLNSATTSITPASLGKTRQQYLQLKQDLKSTNKKQLKTLSSTKEKALKITPKNNYSYYENFSIYDAFSYLLSDIDGDGYYQSFSIVFDADFYTTSFADHANVYAELYLSKDGGPWTHYYSTETFTIYGESDDDEYEVMTILEQGFTSGYYDVLIDLYDADHEELVVSYSSDDNNALYALPLESGDIDQWYVTEVIYTDGGGFSFVLIGLMSLLGFIRRIKLS